MELEEAIRHCEEVAERCAVTDGNIKCEMEHRQLAEWLKELKERREQDLQPSCNQLATDIISRQEALDAMDTWDKFGCDPNGMLVMYDDDRHYVPYVHYDDMVHAIKSLPSAQPEPSEITDEQAILHLQSTGWMQNHDREMYESGLREQLADDSGSYDNLIPCEDTISRTAAIDVAFNVFPDDEYFREQFVKSIEALPSAQTEWNNHTVACLLAELFDDTCACNYNGIDEWLPEKCEVIDSCPNPVGVACWEQYLKHRTERRTDE